MSRQFNKQKLLGRSIAFSITFIIVNNLGLAAVRANETIQPLAKPLGTRIDLQQSVDIKSSDRAFRSFKSIDWKPHQSQFSARAVYIASSGSNNLPENQVITNPANQSSNSSIVTGTIRGVFSF